MPYNDKVSFIAHIGIVTCVLNHYISGQPRAAIYPLFAVILEIAQEAHANLDKAWDHATSAILEALTQMNSMASQIDHEPVDIDEVQKNLAMWRNDPSTFMDEETKHLMETMKKMVKGASKPKKAPPTPNLTDLGKGLKAQQNPLGLNLNFRKEDIRWD